MHIYNVRNCLSLVRSHRLLRVVLVCPNLISRVGQEGGCCAARDCAAKPLSPLEIRLSYTGTTSTRR